MDKLYLVLLMLARFIVLLVLLRAYGEISKLEGRVESMEIGVKSTEIALEKLLERKSVHNDETV